MQKNVKGPKIKQCENRDLRESRSGPLFLEATGMVSVE